jgi:hypothetical protein
MTHSHEVNPFSALRKKNRDWKNGLGATIATDANERWEVKAW